MARRTFLIILAFVFAANLQPAYSFPINWDKVDLNREQKETVKKVDDLLNQLLKQLEEMFHKKPRKNLSNDLPSRSEEDASVHSEVSDASVHSEVSVEEHTYTYPVGVPVTEIEEVDNDEHRDYHIVFPQ